MRKLAWAALGFAVACGLGEYLLPIKGLPYFAAALAISSLAALPLKKKVRRRAVIFLLFAAIGVGAWWLHYERHVAPCEAMAGQTVALTARVTEWPERHTDYERVYVRVTSGAPKEPAILYLYTGSLPELEPGDVITAEVRLSSAMIRQGQRVRYNTSQNINLQGYIQPDTLAVTGRAKNAWIYFPRRISRGVEQLCQALFPEDVVPILKGLLTGDTAELEDDVQNYTAMRTAGVMHIVAVSGLHLFVLLTFLQFIFGHGRRTSLICIPLILLFTLMSGCRASIVRAAVMQILYLLAPVFDRESDGITCLCAALFLLLVVNPMAIGGVGLQLSFACMAGLVLLLPRITVWMSAHLPMNNAFVRRAAENLACTVSATAFSLPLSALYFGELPLFSLLSNLLTLYVVEVCFASAYAICAVGAFLPGLGQAAGWLLAWPLRGCLWVYRTIAAIPSASLYAGSSRAVLWLALTYALIAFWYFLRKRGHTIRPDVPFCLAVIGLCLVLLRAKLTIPEGQGLLAALDVGQGECVVLADSGHAVMIDCGGSGLDNAGDTAVHYLSSIGMTRLDLLILSHLHDDHANGVETLLYRIPVGTLILPAENEDGADELRRRILNATRARDVNVLLLEEECSVQVGDIGLSLLLPQAEDDDNEKGIVVLADMLGQRDLIMGDAGEDAELSLLARHVVPDVDVLVAGHHGSRTASTRLFLLAARPETAVISVGYNTYGHPTQEALERLNHYCGAVRRTDLEGTVIITTNGDENDYG